MNHKTKQDESLELRTYKLNSDVIVKVDTLERPNKTYSLACMGDDYMEADATSEEMATLICKGRVAKSLGVKADDVVFESARWQILDPLCDHTGRRIEVGDQLAFVDGPTQRFGEVTEIVHSRYVILDFVDGIDVGKDGEQYVIVTAPAEEDSK